METCRELFGTTVRMAIITGRGRAEKIGPLLSDVERDLDDGRGSEVHFQISPVLRLVLAQSNHWAALSRRVVMAFASRYALRLYEVIAIRFHLRKPPVFRSSKRPLCYNALLWQHTRRSHERSHLHLPGR